MQIILISTLTLAASFVGTLTGFGSSTLMLPIMALFFPLPLALLFVGIIHLFNDFWKIILFKHGVHWRLLLTFGIPGIIASFLGARIALTSPQTLLSQILGAVLIIYVFLLIFEPQFKLPHNTLSAGVGGSLSGIMAGLFGVGGPVRSMFLSAFDFPKHIYLFTSGAIAVFIDVSRLITYYSGGTRLEGLLYWGLLIFIPISFVGAEIAKKMVDKIPQEKFRHVVGIFLFAVGVKLLFFP